MWISRAHFNLIRERASEFRQWHEERMLDRNDVIRDLQARIAASEDERRSLVDRLAPRQVQSVTVPVAPPVVPESEPATWEAMLAKQIAELQEGQPNAH